MKYLFKFHINENVAQAKAILKKHDIEETDGDYLKIREMIKGNEGYTGWFVKQRYENNQPLPELKNVWEIVKDKSGLMTYFTKPFIEMDTVEDFWDEVEHAKIKSAAKKVVNQFPSHQKKFFDLSDQDDLDLLTQLSKNKSLPALIRKISSFRDKKTLVETAKRLLKSGLDTDFDKMVTQISNTGATIKVADEENNIIICEVDYNQIKKLGGDTSWCIVRSKSTFDSYASGGHQWIIFLVDNRGSNDRMYKIGLTTHFGYDTAHDKYDGHITKDRIEKILKDRGVALKDLYITIETLMAKPNWNDIPVGTLLDYGISKENILKKKEVLKNTNRYNGRGSRSTKNDIDFFTKKEREEWDLVSKQELNWDQLKKFDKETILNKKCIQRLDYQRTLTDLFKELKLTKEEVIEHKIYKSATITGEALSYFNKEELVNLKIINLASNLKITDLFGAGFTKDEIIKNYSSSLDGSTRKMLEFFGKDATPAKVRDKISTHWWSSDWEKLGFDRDSSGRTKSMFKLNTMVFYEIGPKYVQILPLARRSRSSKRSLVDIFTSSEKLPIEKSVFDTLYKLGYQITDLDSFRVFLDIFGLEDDRRTMNLKLFNRWIAFADILKLSDKESYEIMDKKIEEQIDKIVHKTPKSNSWAYRDMTDEEWEAKGQLSTNIDFNYFDYIREAPQLEKSKYWEKMKSQLKKSKTVSTDNWSSGIRGLRTKDREDRDSWRNISIENTIKFADTLGITKEDFGETSLKKIAGDMFDDDVKYSSDIEKVLGYFKRLGYEINGESTKSILKGIMNRPIQEDRYRNDNGEVVTKKVYSEDFAKQLLERDIDLDIVLPLIISYVRSHNKLSSYEEKSYRELYKDRGEEWVKKMEEAINYSKNKEHQYEILSDLKHVFGSGGYRSTKSPKEWYDKYFEEYVAGLSVQGYNKYEQDNEVAMILVRLNKFDELDKIKKWDLSQRGFSFDTNLLNSFAKVICKSSVNYHRHYKDAISDRDENDKAIEGDVKARKFYDWILDHVDESQYYVKAHLLACYYKFERAKYDAFVNEVMTMKDNHKSQKYSKKDDDYVDVTTTLRVAPLRYVLMYFATKGMKDEYEKLVRRLFEYRKEGTPRALKMNNPEFNSTTQILERIHPDSYTTSREYQNEFDKFNKQLIAELKNTGGMVRRKRSLSAEVDNSIRESKIFNWKEFNT